MMVIMYQVFVEGLPEVFAPFGSLCLLKAELLSTEDDRYILLMTWHNMMWSPVLLPSRQRCRQDSVADNARA